MLISIMAAWLLLVGVGYWSYRETLGLSRDILIASVRTSIQLLLFAFVLHWLFDIQLHWSQMVVILFFCTCLLTLTWLVFVGAFEDEARTLVPLCSMIAANGMNAIFIMFERLKPSETNTTVTVKQGLHTALISPINTLKVVGLMHIPGVFVGVILVGSTVFDAATAQLVVLYMVVTSSFMACVVNFLVVKPLHKSIAD